MLPIARITSAANKLRTDMSWGRLLREDEGVEGRNIVVRSLFAWIGSILPHPGYLEPDLWSNAYNLIRSNWRTERIDIRKGFLTSFLPHTSSSQAVPHAPSNQAYAWSHFMPRWLLKVTYEDTTKTRVREVSIVAWTEDDDAIIRKGYTAISYAYEDAKTIFKEKNPTITDLKTMDSNPYLDPKAPEDPLMTAWKEKSADPKEQGRWAETGRRQRVARAFLDCYLDARCALHDQELRSAAAAGKAGTSDDNVEYVWLDEFCLYAPSLPSLSVRAEELGRMADVFAGASNVCVYCPIKRCNHVNEHCIWGNRLWTLAEILRNDSISTLTRQRIDPSDSSSPWTYGLTYQPGHAFRSSMQHAAEANGRWHLHAIMRHANNGGSTTWQHTIQALLVEAILRDQKHRKDSKVAATTTTTTASNTMLAKALNGLLPRRAHPKDLKGENGWKDLAWLLELNQGFYNAATLAAVCGLGDSADHVGQGWLGPPIPPSPGNERLHPLVDAFPVPDGLFIIRPKIIGLKRKLKRDLFGMYRNKRLRPTNILAIATPYIGLLLTPWLGFGALLAAFASTVGVNFVGMTLYLEKTGIYLYMDGPDPKAYLHKRDNEFEHMEQWGSDQLAPRWESDVMHKEVSLVDLKAKVYTTFFMRELPEQEQGQGQGQGEQGPNALIPLAVHGCGVTCLVLQHDDPIKPAKKLGIVNMPPHILVYGEEVGSMVIEL